jgi:hypothetical protein
MRVDGSRVSRRVILTVIGLGLGLAVALAGRGPAAAAGPPGILLAPPPPAAFAPHLTGAARAAIGAAWQATVARDRACDGTHGRQLTTGSPSRALLLAFAVLRRPATPAHRLRRLLQNSAFGPPPGNLPRGVEVSERALYLNQIRVARSAYGARFYVIPAGNVSGQRGVPERCRSEQVAALTLELSHASAGRRARMLAAQARYLAYLAYQARHPEGICATFVPAHATALDLVDNLGCARLSDFQRWGVLADASAYLGGRIGVFWTVVPDGVATVTLRFRARDGRAPATFTVHPVNNVVVVREPFHAPYQSGVPSTIVLRSAGGGVIKKVRTSPNMITLCGYGC